MQEIKSSWNPLVGYLDTSPDINELALLDPITAEIEGANGHRVIREIKL